MLHPVYIFHLRTFQTRTQQILLLPCLIEFPSDLIKWSFHFGENEAKTRSERRLAWVFSISRSAWLSLPLIDLSVHIRRCRCWWWNVNKIFSLINFAAISTNIRDSKQGSYSLHWIQWRNSSHEYSVLICYRWNRQSLFSICKLPSRETRENV